MATRLYLRATTTNTGGYVATEKSTVLPVGTSVASGNAAADLKTAKGASQTTSTVTSLAQTAHQDEFLKKFISDTLGVTSVDANTWTIGLAVAESAAQANSFLVSSIYVLKSDDTVRGFVYDSDTALGAEFGLTEDGQVYTVSGSAVASVVSTDRLCVEVWVHASQANATARTNTLYFDGATDVTDTTTTDAASYVETPQQLFVSAATVSDSVAVTESTGFQPVSFVAPSDAAAVAESTGRTLVHNAQTTEGGGAQPDSITGLKLWLKADSETYNDGDPVSTATDRSGNGNNYTQTGGARPTFKTAIVNGKPVYRFDAALSQYLVGPDHVSGFTAGEIFFVVKRVLDPPTVTARVGLCHFGTDGTATCFPYTDSTIYDGFGTNTRKTTVDPTPSLASWRIYNVSSAAGAWTSRLDGTQLYTTGTNTVAFTAAPKFGASRDLDVFLDADVAEVLVYNGVLSSADRQTVNGYLDGKYALGLGLATGGVTISEAVARTLVDNAAPSDSVAVSESVSIFFPYEAETISDTITVTENVAVTLTAGVTDLAVQVSDSVTVAESVTELLTSFIAGSDSVAVSEQTIENLVALIAGSDSVALTENTVARLIALAAVSDSVAVTENKQALLVALAAASDSVTVTEQALANLTVAISTSDAVAVSEALNMILATAGVDLVTASDSVTVTEQALAQLANLVLAVSDSLTVNDTPAAQLQAVPTPTVTATDSVAVSEHVLLDGLAPPAPEHLGGGARSWQRDVEFVGYRGKVIAGRTVTVTLTGFVTAIATVTLTFKGHVSAVRHSTLRLRGRRTAPTQLAVPGRVRAVIRLHMTAQGVLPVAPQVRRLKDDADVLAVMGLLDRHYT